MLRIWCHTPAHSSLICCRQGRRRLLQSVRKHARQERRLDAEHPSSLSAAPPLPLFSHANALLVEVLRVCVRGAGFDHAESAPSWERRRLTAPHREHGPARRALARCRVLGDGLVQKSFSLQLGLGPDQRRRPPPPCDSPPLSSSAPSSPPLSPAPPLPTLPSPAPPTAPPTHTSSCPRRRCLRLPRHIMQHHIAFTHPACPRISLP